MKMSKLCFIDERRTPKRQRHTDVSPGAPHYAQGMYNYVARSFCHIIALAFMLQLHGTVQLAAIECVLIYHRMVNQ